MNVQPVLKDRPPVDQFPQQLLPILITGVAGVAGYNAFYHFRRRFGAQAIGIRPYNNWPLRDDGIIGCDIEDRPRLDSIIKEHGIRSVLNCGGSCALKACELDPQMAQRVNVFGVRSLLDSIESAALPLVHLSIDLVFSGASGIGGYVETDPTDPVTVYGKTMVAAEQEILSRRPDAAILRISLPMGISFNGHAGAIDWIQSRFKKSKPATLYFDEVRTPTYVECLNEVIEATFARQLNGLFHAGGTNRWSLFQIAQIVNRVGGYAPELLMGCPRIDAGPIPPRAGNVTMNSSKLAEALGRQPFNSWPSNQGLFPTDQEWHFDRKDYPGCPSDIERQLYQRVCPNKPDAISPDAIENEQAN
ncbi:MAG: sugar nucleotide-binding protein [Planctomycetota bacterium]